MSGNMTKAKTRYAVVIGGEPAGRGCNVGFGLPGR